jgi:hypothetical protein
MSYHRSLANNESEQSRDPRQRDRSRSDIRRPDTPDTLPTSQPVRQEQTLPTNNVIDFFQTLGLNAQLIQALINANPPKIEQVQQQPLVNNAQEFASFLSKSYGLEQTITPTPNQSVNRGNNTIKSSIEKKQFLFSRSSTSKSTYSIYINKFKSSSIN